MKRQDTKGRHELPWVEPADKGHIWMQNPETSEYAQVPLSDFSGA